MRLNSFQYILKMKKSTKRQLSFDKSPKRSGSAPKGLLQQIKHNVNHSLNFKPQSSMLHAKPSSLNSKTIVLNTIKEEHQSHNRTKKTKNQLKKKKNQDKNKHKIQKNHQSPKRKKIKSIDKEKKKKINYSLCLKQLKPMNLEEQKKKFFQSQFNYNPTFLYPNILDLTEEEYKEIKHFENPNEQYIELAIRILQKSLKIKEKEEVKLSIEETSNQFDMYIKELNIGIAVVSRQ